MSTHIMGLECPRCNTSERYIRNQKCATCARISARKSRANNLIERRATALEEHHRKYKSVKQVIDTGPWDIAFGANKRRAKEKNALGENYEEEKELIRGVYKLCYQLNRLWGTDMVVDHVKPFNKGGKHEWMNLQLLDGALNYRKGDAYPWHYEIKVVNGAIIEQHIPPLHK